MSRILHISQENLESGNLGQECSGILAVNVSAGQNVVKLGLITYPTDEMHLYIDLL